MTYVSAIIPGQFKYALGIYPPGYEDFWAKNMVASVRAERRKHQAVEPLPVGRPLKGLSEPGLRLLSIACEPDGALITQSLATAFGYGRPDGFDHSVRVMRRLALATVTYERIAVPARSNTGGTISTTARRLHATGAGRAYLASRGVAVSAAPAEVTAAPRKPCRIVALELLAATSWHVPVDQAFATACGFQNIGSCQKAVRKFVDAGLIDRVKGRAPTRVSQIRINDAGRAFLKSVVS